MANRDASVDFTANTDQYTAALSAAIQVTDQYSKAADTALGAVARMGGGIANKWVQGTSAITQVNKTATAQAAMYQTKLTAIETTSKVLGDKSFPKMEKSVKSLARTFPIGIDKAVEQYKALQESGVTVEKQVSKLAVSYTKLGAVTNTNGPDIGKQMTEFTRSMGNSLNQVDGMGDSLTMLTKKFGGTAAGVLGFSKSIAPIAATVGMNQTQVMGLSTAFSRLGEDGFAAGNAVNKVLLDMSRSVREGSPEVRGYAQALGMTVEETKEMFKNDPTEVVTRFMEAINKAGPNAIRTLEGLGLEGVRTAKSITLMASQGNLREIIDESARAYKSGAMTAGAETAMGGVNDEMAKLNETMSQMVAESGKPFLNIMTGVLRQANAISGVFTDIAASPLGQTVGVGAQAAGGAIGLAGGLVSQAMTIGLGVRGLRAVRGAGQSYMQGRRVGIAQNLGRTDWVAEERSGTRIGQMAQRQAIAGGWRSEAALMASSGMGMGATLRQRVGGGAMYGLRAGRQLATLGMLATAQDMQSAMGNKYITPVMSQQFKDEAQKAMATFKATGSISQATAQLGPNLLSMAQKTKDGSLAFTGLTAATKEVTKATGSVYLKSMGGAAKGLLSIAGMGMGATAGGVLLGVGGAALAYSSYKKSKKAGEEILEESKADPFKTFNEFAEKAGMATKSIQALGQASKESAKALLAHENTTMAAALTLSDAEYKIGKESGYTAGFESSGNAALDAVKAVLMNPSASPEEVGRIVTDIGSKGGRGAAQEFGAAYSTTRSAYEADPMKFINEQIAGAWDLSGGVITDTKESFGAMSKEGAEAIGLVTENLNQLYQENLATGGAEYAERKKAERVEEMYQAGSVTGLTKEKRLYHAEAIAAQTGGDAGAIADALQQSALGRYEGKEVTTADVVAGIEGALKPEEERTAEQRATSESMASLAAGTPVDMSKAFDAVKDAMLKADASTQKMTGETINLTDVLSEGNDLAKENNKAIDDLNEGELGQLSDLGKAIAKSQAAPEDVMLAQHAGQGLAEDVLRQAKGSPEKARMGLVQTLATASPEMKPLIQAAINQVAMNPEAIATQVHRAPLEQMRTRIETKNAYLAQGMPDASDAGALAEYNQVMQDGAAATQEYASTMVATVKMVRDSLKQQARAQEDFAVSQAHNRAQFNRQRKWAAEDYQHQTALAERNFQQSQKWAEEDYLKGRARAYRDFAIQNARAQEDFNKAQTRAQDDFTKQMERGDEDYLKGRNRAYADHDKQLKRQIEDTAKSMYDPYQRVQHERVWSTRSLLGNMAEQEKVLKKQMAQLEKLKEMGVSQQAIDVLGLADPQKAQQLFKVYADTLSDPTLIGQLNSTVESRMGVAGGLATSENNVSYRRGEEDFAESIKRMDEDYRTQVARANEDFLLSMQRQQEDFATNQKRALDDFNKAMTDMAVDYQTQMSRSKTQYDQQMAEIEFQYNEQRKRQKTSFDSDMAYAASQFATSQARVQEDLALALTDMVTDYDGIVAQAETLIAKLPADVKGPLQDALGVALTYMDEELANHKWADQKIPVEVEMNFTTGQVDRSKLPPWLGGTADVYGTGGYNPVTEEDMQEPETGPGTKGDGPTGKGRDNWSGNWRSYSGGGFHGGADMGHKGGGAYAVVGGTIKRVATLASHQSSSGSYGKYAVLTDGRHDFYYAHMSSHAVRQGQKVSAGDRIGTIGNTGNTRPIGSGYHLHFEARPAGGSHTQAVNPGAWMALGGIAMKQMRAMIGEAGHPEAVVPLNERGVGFLKSVMDRYLPNAEAQEARVAPYASAVTINNYTYDQSTKVSGPITIKSNDPNDMARQLAAKQRRDRLRQPVGR